MKAFAMVLLLAIGAPCFAGDETNLIAISDWSQPVSTENGHSLRARMIVAYGRGPAFTGRWDETQFFLEFQNVSGAATSPMKFYFDPLAGLRCEMKDATGKTPSQAGGGSGGGPSASWIILPYNSTIRLRANMYGYGKKQGDGLLLCLWPPTQYWDIPAGDTNVYYLSGTFTVTTPTNYIARDFEASRAIWSGTLDLPKMQIQVPKL